MNLFGAKTSPCEKVPRAEEEPRGWRRVGERNKFTIEKLNSSRSALAEKGASDSEAHEFIARSVCGA